MDGDAERTQRPYSIPVTCPSCSSPECYRVNRLKWQDHLYRLVGQFPWHCRQCQTRFYLWRRSLVVTTDRFVKSQTIEAGRDGMDTFEIQNHELSLLKGKTWGLVWGLVVLLVLWDLVTR